MAFTLETHCRVYDDKTGEAVAVIPNADGLPGILDIVQDDRVISLPFEQAVMVAKAINLLVDKYAPVSSE